MIPHFSAVDFVSFYVEIPVMVVMYIVWITFKRLPQHKGVIDPEFVGSSDTPPISPKRVRWFDLVDISTVNLHRDEYEDAVDDLIEDQERDRRMKGRIRWLWRLYYTIA